MGLGISAGTAAAIAAGVGAAASLGGTIMSANAQKASANAIAYQNQQDQLAQAQGFNARMNAARQQTAAQSQVMQQTLQDRFASARDTYQQQQNAQDQRNQVLAAENQQAEALRAQADQQAQDLVTRSQDITQNSQQQSQQQAAALLAASDPKSVAGAGSPDATDPNVDASTQAALARRAATASSNVRNYGQKVATLQSYSQPLADIGQAITESKIGIMPVEQAAKLLSGGSAVRLLPSQVSYSNAGTLGQATDAIIQSRGQSGLNLAGLEYQDANALANLQQSDATTLAANRSRQAQADAQYQQSLGGIISGIGNLGLYAGAYYGGNPFKSSGGSFAPAIPAGTSNYLGTGFSTPA